MKGPRGRWQFPIHRIWECPRCHKQDLTSGQVVWRACRCSASAAEPTWMCLIEESRVKPVPQPPEISPPISGPDAPPV